MKKLLLIILKWLFNRRSDVPDYPVVSDQHCWEAVLRMDSHGNEIGYCVRWSEPDELGRYLWVGHYYSGNPPSGPSPEWCEHAAERHAERKNKAFGLSDPHSAPQFVQISDKEEIEEAVDGELF